MSVNLVKGEFGMFRLKGESVCAEEMNDLSNNSIEIISTEEKSSGGNVHVIPVKLKPDEAKRAYKYQKTMMDFAYMQYKKSKGTPKENLMKKFYNEAIVDYNTFVLQYKNELEKW